MEEIDQDDEAAFENEDINKKEKRKKKKQNMVIVSLLVILIVIIGIFVERKYGFFDRLFLAKEKEPEIITESSLYKIVDKSDLSTYQCTYNDICTVMDKEDPEKVAYYCAYEAKVDAGIDVTQTNISLVKGKDKNIISITIPRANITDANVDISSLDYMFVEDSAENDTVSNEAYKACIEDVTQKSINEDSICELAQKNAENVVRALVEPFVEQVNSEKMEYEIQIKTAEVE